MGPTSRCPNGWPTILRWVLAVLLALASTWASAQAKAGDFDHTRTGYALTGVHAKERCDACHLNGVFKGTPRDCTTCHTSGARIARDNVVKPQRHLPTQESCDACHNTQTFGGAKFTHAGVQAGSCASCHNGNLAQGKPSAHLQTTASCDSCHRTSGWRPASGFDHAGVAPGTCLGCHNGSRATGKNAMHVPTSQSCDDCHRNFSAWRPTAFNHTQGVVANACATCHTGTFPPADGRNAGHIPYQNLRGVAIANCDSCHKAGYSAWTPAKFHGAVSIGTQCATCHNGSFAPAVGKPATAIHNGATVCESCHKSTSDWSSAKVDHSGYGAATNCASCHNGSAATGKKSTHVPVGTTSCYSCHTTTAWKPTKWTHSQVTVANQCATCHTGGFPPADGRPANHIPYALVTSAAIGNCDSCHKAGYGAWTPARFHASVSVSSQCALCHTGSYPPAVGKPATAIHNGVTVCEGCHKSTSDWSNAKVDHSTYGAATNCASCHNGSAATGKNTTHVPVGTTNCYSCHTTTAWKPTKWTHSQVVVASRCSTCHSGSYPPADGKPANHIPYQLVTGAGIANCDTCHKAGYAAWTPAKFHGPVSVSTQCALCHTGSYPPAVGKPATAVHVGVTVCESCHRSTADWSNVQYTHAPANAVGTGTCDTCHNGSTAKGKTPTHIPIPAGTAKCDSCHRSQASFGTSVTMNHSVVSIATCKSCHNGNYTSQGTTGALAKPTNHIPESQLLNGTAMDCKACHPSTAAWSTVAMNHNGSLGSGAGWCKACHASGTAYLGDMEKMPLTHERRTPVPTDCSESGCHRPLGNKGAAYSKWD